ncbi:MCE family protein [Mycobacterium intracellulare]|uniref:MCE family protein n=1 Tax=Mycobacterium intracellulare TaxID=1767 RepID=UPI001EED457E
MQVTPRRVRGRQAIRCGLSCAAVGLLLSGCQFGGLNSLDMPGTAGHGPGSFKITVELSDIATLAQNSPVMVDDVTVGSISGMGVEQRPDGTFCAAVQLSLDAQVNLPTNAVVKVAQTSLLGSQHIELSRPVAAPAVGRLSNGQVIPVNGNDRYPTTEEVLSSLSIVVNKGNLGALQDITDELYQTVAGRTEQFADFLPQLATLAAGLDRQTDHIIEAADKLNHVSSVLADGKGKLDLALRAVPEALRVLNADSGQIVATFDALRRLGVIAANVLSKTKRDFTEDVKAAYPVVKALSEKARELVNALPLLVTYPLPQKGIKQAVRGDFLNIDATFDLTIRRLGETLFTTSALDPNMKHLAEVVNPPDYLLGALANLSGQAADPFSLPTHDSPAAAKEPH